MPDYATAREAFSEGGYIFEAVETMRSLIRQLAVTEPAHSPIWTERSLRRRFETLQGRLLQGKPGSDRR